MILYTSYLAKTAEIRKRGLTPVCIASLCPEWFGFFHLPIFAPDIQDVYDLKNGRLTEHQFAQIYRERLERLDTGQIILQLSLVSRERPAALLCYEKPPKFCHRHTLTAWLTKILPPGDTIAGEI